ncbi:MAG: hypothetical protein K0Q73_1240 [Paenibacillus sp.]|nr:hypothetical protein [Paenibacillus sp.]
MQKRLARFVSSLLIVCMVAASWPSSNSISVSAAAAPLIYEDFEDGIADNFVLSPGSGAYEVAAVNGNQVYRSNYNGPQYTTYQASDLPDDYSVEAKVRLNSWGATTPATVGLFLNYTDTEHYYAVGYEKSSNATGGSRFSIRKRFQGATTYLAAQSSTTPFSLNTDIVIKGEIVGNQIRLYVNGALLLEATDSAPFTSGNPGLYALRTNIEYDNFAVYDASPAAAPQAPTNLSVTSKTETTVGLEWTPGTREGVSGYQILSSGAAIDNVTSAVYDAVRQTVTAQVYQLAPNTTYTLTVKAIGENGRLSEASQAVMVTTNSIIAPEPPTNLRAADKTSNTIMLEWEPSTTAEVIEYRIYSGDTQLHNVSQVSYNMAAQSYSATVFNLSPSTAYTFTVKAVSAIGVISADSNTCSETTGVISGVAANPYTVGNIRASISDSNVPENAIDTDIMTRWSAFGDGQWIELDLGAQRSVGYLGVAFYRGDTRMKAIEIEISDDAITWTKVYQGISGGKTAGLEAFGWGEPKQARYVRVIGRGVDEWTSINEIQVYAPHPDGYVLGVLEAPPAGPDPNAPIPTKPGLYDAAGNPHNLHMPDPVTGQTLNVVDYGANPEDNGADDAPAIRAALEAAKPGDEVYIPNGHYQLISTSSDHVSHLQIKSGVQLRGESQDGVLLVSDHANEIGEYATSEGIVIRITAQHHIRISNMTITSSWNGKYSTDINNANPERGGPKQSIYITGSRGTPSYNITVDHVTVEKFQRMGVAIIFSHDVVVQNSLFRNATDVSGGGSGYGVSIESKPKENRLGRGDDTYFNVVRNNTFIGPYVRHGTIMQYYAHNNLIEHNKYQDITLDAVDFHGEDEYLNEVRNNHFVGGGEAAIGVGNSGATHDASGPGNYIHDNLIENVRRYGVQVYLGSPDTVIENNTIRNFTHSGSQGIRLKNAPGTIVRSNIIENNTAANFWGVVTLYDVGDAAAGGNGAGTPENILIQDNTITGNTNGVDISAGTNILLAGNVISTEKSERFIKDGRSAH